MKKSLRNILIFGGIAVALFVVYFVFFNNNTPPTQTTSTLSSTARTSTTTPLAATPTTGSTLLALLGRVNTLTLNDDIFANPAFDMLQDISIVLPPIEARGRRNPFAPIGANNAAATTTANPSTGTVSAGSQTVTNPQ